MIGWSEAQGVHPGLGERTTGTGADGFAWLPVSEKRMRPADRAGKSGEEAMIWIENWASITA
jgi:hypothetical protein